MSDIIYLIQFIEYDDDNEVIFSPVHCKNKEALIKCIHLNFIAHMEDYKELYELSDELLQEIKCEIMIADTVEELKEVAYTYAMENDELLFGWVVHEYPKQLLVNILLAPDEQETK